MESKVSKKTLYRPRFHCESQRVDKQLNSFPINGHTLGFCPWNQKLENFVSPKVSLRESKG